MFFINDGFRTRVTFADAPFPPRHREREVTPPSIEAGGEIDTTTMRNVRWRTKQAKSLLTLGNLTMSVSYDPAIYLEIVALIGKNRLFTVIYPDRSLLRFFGWLDSFKPGALKEGEFPAAEMTVICSNVDLLGDEIITSSAADASEALQAAAFAVAVAEAVERAAAAAFRAAVDFFNAVLADGGSTQEEIDAAEAAMALAEAAEEAAHGGVAEAETDYEATRGFDAGFQTDLIGAYAGAAASGAGGGAGSGGGGEGGSGGLDTSAPNMIGD